MVNYDAYHIFTSFIRSIEIMVKFTIVEEDSHYLDNIYSEFKEDFLKPEITVKNLKDKYGLSIGKYNQLRDKVLAETGLKIKPYAYCKPNQYMITDKMYLHKNPSGTYTITKAIDKVKLTFGTYGDFETAKMVRDKLIKSGWDKKFAKELIKKYAISKREPAKEVVFRKYDEFEELYLKGYTMKETLERLGITKYQYSLLSKDIKNKYNVSSKFELVKLFENKQLNILKKIEKNLGS